MPAPSPARSLLYSKHTVDLPTLLEVVRLLVDRVEHLEQELARERDEVVMQTGAAAVILKKDGSVRIKGKEVTLDASGQIKIEASGRVSIKGASVQQN